MAGVPAGQNRGGTDGEALLMKISRRAVRRQYFPAAPRRLQLSQGTAKLKGARHANPDPDRTD
jgi:hypothetical protein